jgi:hypothetical protein
MHSHHWQDCAPSQELAFVNYKQGGQSDDTERPDCSSYKGAECKYHVQEEAKQLPEA